MNRPTLYVSNTVSDERIHKCLGAMFVEEGNNPVETIEVSGENKLIRIHNDIYNASIESPDDFYRFFDDCDFITMCLWEDGDWAIGPPDEFQEHFNMWIIRAPE